MHLKTIIALDQTLHQLAAAQRRLDGIPEWMSELHEEHVAKQTEIDEVTQRAEEAQRGHREAEAALADAQERLSHYQQQISQVSTQREYGALLKEIDTAKSQIAEAEAIGLEAIDLAEAATAEIEELREAFADVDTRYHAELAKWEGEKPAIAASISDLNERIAALREEVPVPYLRLFDRLFERNQGQALAPVLCMEGRTAANRSWRCGVCNYQVRPQVVVEIRERESVVQCDCGKRILYVQDVEPSSADS